MLKDVRLLDADRIGPTRLTLDVEYEGHTFSGNLLSEDPNFLHQLHEKLKRSLDQPMREIGSLEINSSEV